ncbi:MAG: hypothetical protein IKE43_01535 [Coriobacteriales bacterium]|nr:hypothetical protein [Coriobacteriales bacterium]
MAAIAIIISAGLLLAIALNLALKPKVTTKVNVILIVVSLVGGLLFYGVGLWETKHDLIITAICTPIYVLKMFTGVNSLAEIAGSTLVSSQVSLSIFWALHLAAFSSIASAILVALGSTALRYLRLLLSYRGDLVLIYGIDEYSRALGKSYLDASKACTISNNTKPRRNSVVFVTEKLDSAGCNDINNEGMGVITGTAALESQPGFLRWLHLKKRKLTVFALDPQKDKNLSYALKLKAALEHAQIPAQNTQITLPGDQEIIAPLLQASSVSYGFGFVNAYDEAELCARALINICPPWELINFDGEGRATEDFSCVILGFGHHGQAVLKFLVADAQFAGSTFHAAIFSPTYDDDAAYLKADCPSLFNVYDIQGYNSAYMGVDFMAYLQENLNTIKLIVLCTEDEAQNQDLADQLMLFFDRHNAKSPCRVLQCGGSGVCYQETPGSPLHKVEIISPQLLDAQYLDRRAIISNASYDTSDASPWEKWLACDNLSRMSSRASADFSPAFKYMSGDSLGLTLEENRELNSRMLQNLGETEHLRWCAFNYLMGYTPMSMERFKERANEYNLSVAAGKPGNIKIGKDNVRREHVCLVPWDQLDDLSRLEGELTGRVVDYKQLDIKNVLITPRLLEASEV